MTDPHDLLTPLDEAVRLLRVAHGQAPAGTFVRAHIEFALNGALAATDSIHGDTALNTQRQDSLDEQLRDVALMAERMGARDAADHIRRRS